MLLTREWSLKNIKWRKAKWIKFPYFDNYVVHKRVWNIAGKTAKQKVSVSLKTKDHFNGFKIRLVHCLPKTRLLKTDQTLGQDWEQQRERS